MKKSKPFNSPRLFKSCDLELDEDIYYKVVDNLVHNAIKYTPPGGAIEISLGLPEGQADARNVEHLILRVKDNGRGISRELMDNIFEPFYQGSRMPGKMKQGVGIGLALVKELVDFIGGSISVESPVPGRESGACFTVGIPAPNAGIELDSRVGDSMASDRFPGFDEVKGTEKLETKRQAHIHLVEDNPDVLQFLQTELAEDYEVTVSEDGLEAEDFVLKHVPDLVITDVMMPNQAGYELCKHLKVNPVSSHIPVILLTAFKTRHHEEEGLAHGADDYIPKPVSMRVLKLKITNLFTQRERLREKIRQEYGLLPSGSGIRGADKQFLDKAEQVARDFLGDEFVGVESFAREMGISRSNFYKKFRDLTGMSPASFMKVKRLNEASRRIESGLGNITEIDLEVGFSDVSYFSRCFKEHFGCPPSRYSARGKIES